MDNSPGVQALFHRQLVSLALLPALSSESHDFDAKLAQMLPQEEAVGI